MSLTFDQPKISPDTHEPVEQQHNLTVIIGAAVSGRRPHSKPVLQYSAGFRTDCGRTNLKVLIGHQKL